MCIPGLHLSLGIFNRLWTLLEEACSELDFKLAISCDDTTTTINPQIDSTAIKTLSAMRVDLQTQRNYANVITEMVTFYTLTVDGANDICMRLKEDLAKTQQCISDKVPNTSYYIQNL